MRCKYTLFVESYQAHPSKKLHYTMKPVKKEELYMLFYRNLIRIIAGFIEIPPKISRTIYLLEYFC